MSQLLSPRHALVQLLRGAGPLVPGISWGSEASPFYGEVQPPIPALPYVVLTMPRSSVDLTLEKAYVETYKPEICVMATQEDIDRLSSPVFPGSVIWFLDGFMESPESLSGTYFDCAQFTRDDYVVEYQDQRDEDSVKRVLTGKATYTMICNQTSR